MSIAAVVTPALAPPESTPAQAPESIPGQRDFADVLTDPKNFINLEDASELEPFGDDDDDSEEATPPATAKPAGTPDLFKGVKSEVASLMKQIASSEDWDLNDPKNFKLVRRVAEQSQVISEKNRSADPATPAAKSYLDQFNDPEPGTPPAPKPESANPQAANVPAYVAVARNWKSHEDFTPAIQEAFGMDEGPEKNAAVANTMLGFVSRTIEDLYLPQIRHMIEYLQNERLGPVVNQVAEAQVIDLRRGVLGTLAKTEEFADIQDLYSKAGDGEIEVEGEFVEDTWMNRMLVKYPFILDIEVKGKSKAESEKKTFAKRLVAAHQMMKAERANQSDPARAQSLIRTGQQIEKSKRDTVRTGLNAPGAKVPPGGRKSVFESSSDGEMSMADLFK